MLVITSRKVFVPAKGVIIVAVVTKLYVILTDPRGMSLTQTTLARRNLDRPHWVKGQISIHTTTEYSGERVSDWYSGHVARRCVQVVWPRWAAAFPCLVYDDLTFDL